MFKISPNVSEKLQNPTEHLEVNIVHYHIYPNVHRDKLNTGLNLDVEKERGRGRTKERGEHGERERGRKECIVMLELAQYDAMFTMF